MLAVKQWTRRFHRRIDDFRESDALLPDLELAACYARNIQQIIEQQGHMSNLSLDHVMCPLQLLGHQLWRPENLCSGPDRCKRVAQFVRESRQELVLAAIGVAYSIRLAVPNLFQRVFRIGQAPA